MATQESQSLYERLGGSEGIPPLVDDIVEAHMENPTIGPRFRPYAETPERLAEIKEHLIHFLAEGSGGPSAYTGRSMPETHRGMNISVEEYMAAVDDIIGAMEDRGLGEETRKDVLAIAYQLKPEIVGK